MYKIWLKKANELLHIISQEYKKTGSIDSKRMHKYKLLVEASERCSGKL